MGLGRKKYFLFAFLCLGFLLLYFQNCSAPVQFREPPVASKLDDARIYDGKLAITNLPEGGDVSGYQQFNGSCVDGFSIVVQYGSGASGPASVNCVSGSFSFAANLFGASGDRSVTLSQAPASGPIEMFTLTLHYIAPAVNYGTGFTGDITVTALDPVSGKVYVGGRMTSYQGVSINGIARLNPDGSLDSTFVRGTGMQGPIYGMAYDPVSQGVYVTGSIYNYNGTRIYAMARILSNGTLDPTFDTGGVGFNNDTYECAVDPISNKVYVAGWFDSYRGQTVQRIVRLNRDGSIDPGFNTSSGLDMGAFNLKVEPGSGKIYVGGIFTSYKGVAQNRLVRINADASLDTTFKNGQINGVGQGARAFALDSSQRVYVAGTFAGYNAVSRKGIFRILNDGTLDPTFNPGTGFSGSVDTEFDGSIHTLTYDSTSDKIYVGGSFNSYNGMPVGTLIRLNSDGSLDPSFVTGVGFNLAVHSVILGSGKLSAFGNFTQYNSTLINGLARLLFDGSLSP